MVDEKDDTVRDASMAVKGQRSVGFVCLSMHLEIKCMMLLIQEMVSEHGFGRLNFVVLGT